MVNERMASQLNVALIYKLCGSLMCLAYFFVCHPWVFVQPGKGRKVNSLGHIAIEIEIEIE